MKKISIITGASSGMGVCFARKLAEENAFFNTAVDELWLIARREDRLRETAELIKTDYEVFLSSKDSGSKETRNIHERKIWPETRIFTLDLNGTEGALAFKKLLKAEEEAAKDKGGFTISVLVNNAGFGTYGEFADTDTLREMQMIDVNCTALTGITGFALPYMTCGSRIIFTASLASFLPLGNFAVYGASKAYVLSFAVALAAELKSKGIKVTALCPGPVSTEFANVASNGARPKVKHGLSPEKTVEHCLRASRRGKLYSMRFFKWRFKAAASRFVGRYLGAWFTYRFCKRPSN